MTDFFSYFKYEFDRLNQEWNRRSQLTHIIVASILLSFLTYFLFDTSAIGYEHSLLISFIVVAPAVMFHELMHVKVARELEYADSRYIAYFPFLLLSCLIVFFFRAPFLLLPGFASISGMRFVQYPIELYYSKIPSFKIKIRSKHEEIALIALGGPIANAILIILSMIALLLVPPINIISSLFSIILILNFNLLAFNMIPLPVFDGSKVWKGNKKWFAFVWVLIIALGILTFTYFGRFNSGLKLVV